MITLQEIKKFITENGVSFSSKEEAERYEALLKATENFQASTNVLNKTFAAHLKTADGYPFQLGNEYWVIRGHYYSEDVSLERMQFQRGRCEFQLDEDGSVIVILKAFNQINSGFSTHRMEDIYQEHTNAQLRLLEIYREKASILLKITKHLEEELRVKGIET